MAILKGVKDEIDVKVTAEIEQDNGKTLPVPFVISVYKPPVSEAAEDLDRVFDSSDEEADDLFMARKYLKGWKQFPTADGGELDFSADHIEMVMEVREYRKAITSGILSVLLGRDALEKNSSRRGGSGRK